MAVPRRRSLRLAGILLATSGLAGCLDFFQSGAVGIRIENQDDQRHTIDVEFNTEAKTVFTDQYTVPPNEEVRAPDVVEAGEYTVAAVLDSTDRQSIDFHMSGCPSNSLWVVIDENSEFDLLVLDEC